MKIIFLDFDGVLNSYRSIYAHGPMKDWHESRWKNLDPLAVGLIKRLCKETDAKIVISSTWRKLFGPEEFIQKMQQYQGWDNFPIVGVTSLVDRSCRGDEIAEWLESTEFDVERYVIVDDDDDMLEGQPLVNTNGIHGLSIFDFFRMWQILDPDNPHPTRFLEDHEDWECKCEKQMSANSDKY